MIDRDKRKAIWIFSGGPMQEIAVKKILERGYKLIVTDRDEGCLCSGYADELVVLDTFDIKGNLKAAEKLKRSYDIKAVIAPAADCHETVAVVGSSLGLPAISPEISRICRYKYLTRKYLTDAGIRQPSFKLVKSVDEAREFIRKIGGKGVIKATNNSGSRGFSIINHIDELSKEVFERARAEGTTGMVIVEEILYPVGEEIAEQSVETLWYNGDMYWLNWVDRLFRKDFQLFNQLNTDIYEDVAWGVEIGHINPAIHDYRIKMAVHEMVYQAGCAIGMDKEKGGHILKADIMLTDKGPCIIELTPRLSGGWDSSGTTPARGGDFMGGIISLALGERLNLKLWYRYFEYKNPALFATVVAHIEKGALDCIGRKFVMGYDFERERAIQKALQNLKEERYGVRLEQ